MVTRLLVEADIPAVVIIEALTQIAPWTEEIFKRCIDAGYPGWVIEQAGEVIGFSVLSLQSGECHILNLGIHPDHQHQGHGEHLLRHVLGTAKAAQAGTAFLEVRCGNKRAINLYKKLGFTEIGERKEYYPAEKGKNREDARLFAIDLGSLSS